MFKIFLKNSENSVKTIDIIDHLKSSIEKISSSIINMYSSIIKKENMEELNKASNIADQCKRVRTEFSILDFIRLGKIAGSITSVYRAIIFGILSPIFWLIIRTIQNIGEIKNRYFKSLDDFFTSFISSIDLIWFLKVASTLIIISGIIYIIYRIIYLIYSILTCVKQICTMIGICIGKMLNYSSRDYKKEITNEKLKKIYSKWEIEKPKMQYIDFEKIEKEEKEEKEKSDKKYILGIGLLTVGLVASGGWIGALSIVLKSTSMIWSTMGYGTTAILGIASMCYKSTMLTIQITRQIIKIINYLNKPRIINKLFKIGNIFNKKKYINQIIRTSIFGENIEDGIETVSDKKVESIWEKIFKTKKPEINNLIYNPKMLLDERNILNSVHLGNSENINNIAINDKIREREYLANEIKEQKEQKEQKDFQNKILKWSIIGISLLFSVPIICYYTIPNMEEYCAKIIIWILFGVWE